MSCKDCPEWLKNFTCLKFNKYREPDHVMCEEGKYWIQCLRDEEKYKQQLKTNKQDKNMYIVNQMVLDLLEEVKGCSEKNSESVNSLKQALKKYCEDNGLKEE